MQSNHYIGGRIEPPAAGRYCDKFDPRTGNKLGEVALGDKGDIDTAVESSSAALSGWRDRKPIERGRILMDMARAIRAQAATFIELESRESGKPHWLAAREVEISAQYFEFYGGLVNLYHGEVIGLGSGYHSFTRREPFGVVGVILPWNAPLNQAARGIAPALAVGNVVVAKPSEETPSSLLELARLAVDACGLPAGVLNVVLGNGAGAGAALVEHPKVRKVAFTGSVRAGREIGRVAAERILPLTLELGGKSPNIVFDDCDLAAAVAGSIGAFTLNSGQVCLAGTRCYVQRGIRDAFVDAFTEAVSKIKTGASTDALLGPLATRAQFEKVKDYFKVAQDEGLKAVIGGGVVPDQDGWFVQPTVYVADNNDSRIAREEIFGPVVIVIPFDDEDDAVRLANDTDFGLAAGIWTRDLGRALRVSSRLEAGQIYVNEYYAGGVETPLGGFKQSGYGREKGIEALHHYTQLKCVTIKL